MQRTISSLHDCAVCGTDGDIGRIRDVCFDPSAWAIRHLVVETGSSLAHRRVLVSPSSVDRFLDDGRALQTLLARPQASSGPAASGLRNASALLGYHLQALDGAIGHVEDFVFDDSCWAIRYLCIDTHSWWPGAKTVWITSSWIGGIDWRSRGVRTLLSRRAVKQHQADHPSSFADLSEGKRRVDTALTASTLGNTP
jgi:uncharacterized protein YrrD